jgi:hypothetical protein
MKCSTCVLSYEWLLVCIRRSWFPCCPDGVDLPVPMRRWQRRRVTARESTYTHLTESCDIQFPLKCNACLLKNFQIVPSKHSKNFMRTDTLILHHFSILNSWSIFFVFNLYYSWSFMSAWPIVPLSPPHLFPNVHAYRCIACSSLQ